jgi:hypothetical protein
MKTAELFPIPAKDLPGFEWKWRSVQSGAESADSFTYYHDCLSDARDKGYTVELSVAQGLAAPGGAPNSMA